MSSIMFILLRFRGFLFFLGAKSPQSSASESERYVIWEGELLYLSGDISQRPYSATTEITLKRLGPATRRTCDTVNYTRLLVQHLYMTTNCRLSVVRLRECDLTCLMFTMCVRDLYIMPRHMTTESFTTGR